MAGTIAAGYSVGLAVLSDWLRPPRPVADQARWQDRLSTLVRYRAAWNDWPRHKTVAVGEEHVLGVWLHSQHQRAHRGDLNPDKARALPGWRAGRQRGRKPRNGSGTSD